MLKKIIKQVSPPILLELYKSAIARYGFRGHYATWAEAEQASSGYDSAVIIDKVRRALLEVKAGRAVAERDSVLFDEVEYSWPLVACLMKIAALKGNRLQVLDYGGSLGSTYFQNKLFLKGLTALTWSIVEQPHFVGVGHKDFADETLRFYYNVAGCLKEQRPDVIVFSSVLQYLEHPYQTLTELLDTGIEYLLIDRTPFVSGSDRIVVQKVPPSIYPASYPAWLLNEARVVEYIRERYDLVVDFRALDGVWRHGHEAVTYKGFLFKKRTGI